MNENVGKKETLKCLGCHSFRSIGDFDYNKNCSRLKTCNNCRERNKKRKRQHHQSCHIALSEEEMFNDENLILTAKSKNMFFRVLLTYTHAKSVKVKMIRGHDIYDQTEIIKLIFSLTKSMIIIKCNDTWCKIKKIIDEELKTNKTSECSLCFDSYTCDIARMSCTKCYNDCCTNCFLKLWLKNHALIICPFCRDQSGEKLYANESCTIHL